jgi:primosomal protein N' (replication factor Y)
MRAELKAGRRGVLSKRLKELIENTAGRGEQVILLLNRRGFSTFIMCRACGHVVSCAECGLPLTYHKNGRLLCHFCDTSYQVPDVCPECASRYIKYFGTGTEKLEAELSALFPKLKIARMDRDTMGGKTSHAHLLDDFAKGKYDILLGTQMVAKGHDVKNVTGVGIISADTGLNLPDFRAAERCFALLTQAAGRAGRGKIKGSVVVQTYNPEHYAVDCASRHAYKEFYAQEIVLREGLNYPPFCSLIKLTVQADEQKKAADKAEKLVRALEKQANEAFSLIGPFELSIAKLRDTWRKGILLKVKDETATRDVLRKLSLHLDKNICIDVNPLSVM